MSNFKFLLIGTSLSFIPILSYAQCVATQDCATLGYTETSCNGGKGVKCPFGNKWACLGVNEEECEKSFCNKYGFTLTCTGTGYAGGAGSACGGKYTFCTCSSGYEWKDGSCQKKEVLDGAQGDLYYCKGTVVAVKAPEMDFYVAMRDLGIMFGSDARNSCQDYDFCNNIKGSLPSSKQLSVMYNHKSSLNNLFAENGGIKFREDEEYWSSTCISGGDCYYMSMSSGSLSHYYGHPGIYRHNVRPVLMP